MNLPSWDLDAVFPGGPLGGPFQALLASTERDLDGFAAQLRALPPGVTDVEAWAQAVLELERIQQVLHQVLSYSGCAASADAESAAIRKVRARAQALLSRESAVRVPLVDGICRCAEEAFRDLRALPALEHARPWLDEVRQQGHLLLPPASQALAEALAEDGLHAWARLYDERSPRLRVLMPDGRALSVAQAQNLLSSPDPEEREAVHDASAAAWRAERDLWATALSHITGHRLTLARARGVGPLDDALARARMQAATLEALLGAARRALPLLRRYVQARSEALGHPMRWCDQTAPVGTGDGEHGWEVSLPFVRDHLAAWYRPLGEFVQAAADGRWIEAEDRPGKRHGAFCSWHPSVEQSRVFMTHGGNLRSTITLAHELGHAWHNHLVRDLPPLRRHLTMTLAETASTFAENLVRDAALREARSPELRLGMLDQRLQAALVFLANIPARYRFELGLYELRSAGVMDADQLDAAMVAAQQEGYDGMLASWDPTYWSAKLHFFLSRQPFYNFPYLFGYAFSSLVYRRAVAEPEAWHQRVMDLLRRAGWEHAEPLALDVLGVDLTTVDGWWEGIAPIEEDVVAFESLVG